MIIWNLWLYGLFQSCNHQNCCCKVVSPAFNMLHLSSWMDVSVWLYKWTLWHCIQYYFVCFSWYIKLPGAVVWCPDNDMAASWALSAGILWYVPFLILVLSKHYQIPNNQYASRWMILTVCISRVFYLLLLFFFFSRMILLVFMLRLLFRDWCYGTVS